MRRSSRPVLVAILTGFACAFASAAASAGTTCTTAAECQKGYDCTVVGGTACPGVACAPNTVDCPAAPPCTPSVIRECVVGATCTADTDCGANMVCYETSTGSCTGTAAPCARLIDGATDCPTPTAPVCTETKIKNCAFKYTVPCTKAADCGDATLFECVDQMRCWASVSVGGGGTAGGAAVGSGAADTPPPTSTSTPTTPTPTDTPTTAPVPVDAAAGVTTPPDRITDAGCQPTGVKYCRALPKVCTDNTQCPTDWTCKSTGDSACFAMAYADGAAAPCTTQPSTSLCAPPGRGYGTVGVYESADTGGTPPTASPTAGAAGATAQGAPGATAAAAAPADDVSGGGCNVASTGSNRTTGLLVALGALLALGRRRRI